MPRIALIPGDGIGREVAREGLKVLTALSRASDLGLVFDSFDYGADRYLADGTTLPDAQVEDFRRDYDAIWLGAVGDPRVPDHAHAKAIVLGLRSKLDLYVNFRPVRLVSEHICPLKAKRPEDVDFAIFRENTEGAYAGCGGTLYAGTPQEVATCEEIHTRKGVERLVRAAYAWARADCRRRICLVDKANAIPAHRLWRSVFDEVGLEYPEMERRALYADTAALLLVQQPEEFEVIVASNLLGDVLSDLGAALAGGLGLAPAANLHPGGLSLFEPVHGSAPDIAGRGLANPMAMVLSGALMLRTLGMPDSALLLERVVEEAVRSRESTPDLGGRLSTAQVGDRLARRVEAAVKSTSKPSEYRPAL